MILYLIAAVTGAGLLLVLLKAWTVSKTPASKPAFTFKTNASEIERYVRGADRWGQHLRPMPLFWVALFGTMLMLAMAAHFGYVRGGVWGWGGVLLIGCLFGVADLAIPFIALHDATDDGELSWIGRSLIVAAMLMSYMAVIGSTAEISTTTASRLDTGVVSMADTRKLLEIKQKERDSIPVDRGAQALNDLAKSNEEAAVREGGRTRCGDKCESLKKLATDYRAREKEAIRKEKLTGEIEQIKTQMAGAGSAEQRTDADAMATVISGMTFGVISRDGFRVYALTVFGILMVTLVTLLWEYIGGKLYAAIIYERQYRGEIADEQRATLGLGPRYTAPQEPRALLTGPSSRTNAKDDPSVVLNISLEGMRKRFANDADLLETDRLFETLLMPGDGGSVPLAAVYRAYKVASLTRDPMGRYMTQPTMAAKLHVITQYRDDLRVTADGILEGWVLKPAEDRNKTETINAQ